MNRPFPAFAALLALMTLAVLALSATSRSTSISRTPRRPAATSHLEAPGGANFVFLIPGQEDGAEERARDRGAAVTKARSSFSAAPRSPRGPVKPLAPAYVRASEAIPDTAPVACPMDCRSFYDPAYDLIVYGRQAITKPAAISSTSTISTDEMLEIFRELGPSRASPARFQFAAGQEVWLGRLWLRASSASAAARLWITFHIRRLTTELPLFSGAGPVECSELQWSEYAELVDTAIFAGGRSSRPTAGVRRTDVRFSDWLRHSAAPQFSVDGGHITSPAGRQVP